MKRTLMATLATVTLVMGLAWLTGCGGNKDVAGPRGSEEATIRVRNGSLVLELRDEATAKWEHDANGKEWTQNKTKNGAGFVIQIEHRGTCETIPGTGTDVDVVHAQGIKFELRFRSRKTRVKDRQDSLTRVSDHILEYKPNLGNDYISEIWIDGDRICTFKDKNELTHMDLKRQ